MSIVLSDKVKKLARERLHIFIKLVFPEYTMPKHMEYLCNIVEKVVYEEDKRLIISMPPGHGKSFIISQCLPAWLLGRDNTSRNILMSFGSDLANDHGVVVRQIMSSDVYAEIFPESVIRDGNKSGLITTEKGGKLKPVGRDGSITGSRIRCKNNGLGAVFIIDDLVKNIEEATSDKVLDKIISDYTATYASRLWKGSAMVVLMTRWSKKDLIGYLLEKEPDKWEYVNLPAILEEKHLPCPLGRKVGEALWEEQIPLSKLLKTKETNPQLFESLYQGNPVKTEGSIITDDYIKFKLTVDKSSFRVLAIDSASKDGLNNDYSSFCIASMGINGDITIESIHRGRYLMPELLSTSISLYDKFQCDAVYIEGKSSGLALLQMIESKNLGINLREAKANKSKIERVQTVLTYIKNNVYLSPMLLKCELYEDFISEIKEFPFSTNDDMLDSFIHAVSFFFFSYHVGLNTGGHSLAKIPISKGNRSSIRKTNRWR